MTGEYYTHTVNGRIYDSRGLMVDGERIHVESLAHYKRIVRMAYGNLRGVKFAVGGRSCTCGNYGIRPCEPSCYLNA